MRMIRMKKLELRKIGILKRVFNNSVATSIAKAFRLINSETLGESDSQVYSEEFTEPYILYDELKKVRLQLLELEKQKAEAVDFARHRTYI
jgi:hypothetical protein